MAEKFEWDLGWFTKKQKTPNHLKEKQELKVINYAMERRDKLEMEIASTHKG